ncbi:hypothetical protein [Actinoplanes sp. NPDC051859]|uniref:hypothetical protein n=1 Tax=Actinoplanes sp. NPDC051859 TaxID=3363909 RepID=UPI003795A905
MSEPRNQLPRRVSGTNLPPAAYQKISAEPVWDEKTLKVLLNALRRWQIIERR